MVGKKENRTKLNRTNTPMIYSKLMLILIIYTFLGCTQKQTANELPSSVKNKSEINETSLIVLGTVQDAGAPHIACNKVCCAALFDKPNPNLQVVSLGLIDPHSKKKYIFEATPDFPNQIKALKQYARFSSSETPDGIFLTHAHIGHYTGLMYLGKEAMNAENIPVYAMPKMKSFLENNGPWSQLVSTKNIKVRAIFSKDTIHLSTNLKVIPFIVPHRDEYSETVGYKIEGPNKKALFIPDIDKWEKWDLNIIDEISSVDYAFIDGTFYDADEINNRDISLIPHPFIIESMNAFKALKPEEKKKIYFIHFNHTNPVLDKHSAKYQKVIDNGFNLATIKQVIEI